ncbi:MAG TPA: fused MFS/spermidine synthase [Sphingomicrobium sp.]|nr:fused MFS/spermidine synthase [Sphingomicrobium sp.]
MVAVAGRTDSGGRAGRARFVATIFVGSFLLFLVQPMIARMALPRLGGAPSVWNSAMLVYQALLLAGYAYAHWLGRFAPPRQALIHLVLLAIAALTLPIGLMSAMPPPDANPFLWVPWLLLASIGPLFFVVSAQAPLLQRWFAMSEGADPYPLYAASNLGSFGGLIAYPLIVEPLIGVSEQRWLWSVGYGLLMLLVVACAIALPRSAAPAGGREERGAPLDWRQIGRWVLLAAVPSGLILSTTLHITTDLVAMPLLWVLPLAAYLLSFTVAFASWRTPANSMRRLAPLILLLACFAIFVNQNWLALLFCAISILNLFTVGVALHSRLFETRPPARQLTLFYLALSVGGVLGGIFCALIAPLIFDWTYEHLILLVAAAWLMRSDSPFGPIANLWDNSALARRVTIAGIAIVMVLAAGSEDFFGLLPDSDVTRFATLAILAIAITSIGNRALFTVSTAGLLIAAGGWDQLELSATPGKTTRSFFGIYSIRPSGDDARMLVHGTTVHGIQNLGSPDRERIETSYYAPRSGVGLAMQATPQLFGPNARIDVVGLGAGTLACYARPGERWTFYEIDPAIVRIARDPAKFTFLSRCLPDVPIEIGDARLTLARAEAAGADLLVVDAFSSDAIPIHLLTREALGVYGRRLSSSGLLLIHISNRFLNLRPVVAANAQVAGWHGAARSHKPSAEGRALHETESEWIALSRSPQVLGRLIGGNPGWEALEPQPGFAPWSDDYASVLPLFTWGP